MGSYARWGRGSLAFQEKFVVRRTPGIGNVRLACVEASIPSAVRRKT